MELKTEEGNNNKQVEPNWKDTLRMQYLSTETQKEETQGLAE